MPPPKPALVALAALASVVPCLGLADELRLAEQDVFPPGDSASAATLERPLTELWPDRAAAPPHSISIVVHKARRRLDLLGDGRVVKSYLVNLGLAPRGDKERQGDYRTPEGELFVCAKKVRSQFTRFLTLAYPSPAHVERAARRASGALQRMVKDAYRRKDRCPPQSSALGGTVGIHGSGAWARTREGFLTPDWTWGCIGLRDADVLELFEVARVGTAVRILPD